jgi:Prokaryotic N-terminal methylation motif
MQSKNGFLLVELMIGLSIATFFMLIITHYIIELKCTQQKALEKMETFSTLRNETEKALAKK